MKKIISLLSALLIAACSVGTVVYADEEIDKIAEEEFAEFLDSCSGDKAVFISDNWKLVFIQEDGVISQHFFMGHAPVLYIYPTESLEELRESIANIISTQNFYADKINNRIELKTARVTSEFEEYSILLEKLKALECVSEIYESSVYSPQQFGIENMFLLSNIAEQEMENEYGILGIERDDYSDNDLKLEFGDVYNYCYRVNKAYWSNPEQFDALKKLSESDIEVTYYVIIPETNYTPITNLIYSSQKTDAIYGDTDTDEEVNLSDLTLLSQYILKDVELNKQQKANADVNADGEVNLQDLALLKQYVMNDNVQFGADIK